MLPIGSYWLVSTSDENPFLIRVLESDIKILSLTNFLPQEWLKRIHSLLVVNKAFLCYWVTPDKGGEQGPGYMEKATWDSWAVRQVSRDQFEAMKALWGHK